MASKLDFTPTDPRAKIKIHSPEGNAVETSVANAHDLVRFSGYFWTAEDAVAAQSVADSVTKKEDAAKAVEDDAAAKAVEDDAAAKAVEDDAAAKAVEDDAAAKAVKKSPKAKSAPQGS